jgi:hypothetical protein
VSPANNAGDAVDSRLPPATNHPAPEAESTAPSNEALPDPGKRPGAVLFAVAAIFVAAAVLALVVIVVMRRP